MIDGTCFLEKIIGNPALELCAPQKLEKEIMAKIDTKFPKEKKTRDLDLEECKAMALKFLKQIHIQDDIDLDSMAYAEQILGVRDGDDVPFFALSLSNGSHGAITNDKDLRDLEELPTWKLGEAGKMLMTANRGTLALFVTHDVMPIAFQALFEAVCLIWSSVVAVAKTTGSIIGAGIKKGCDIVSDWHPLVQVLAIAGLITLEVKKQPIQKVGSWIIELMKALFEVLKPIIEVLATLLGLSVTTVVELMQCGIEAGETAESLPRARTLPELITSPA